MSLSERIPSELLGFVKNAVKQNPRIEDVILFGSRAKGKFKEGSDVDLCLVGKELTLDDLLELRLETEELNLPVEVEWIFFHWIKNEDLKSHILRVGISLLKK